MVPCPPPQNGIDPYDDDVVSATKAIIRTKTLTDEEKPMRKTTRNTFHWELNLYSFSALALIYYTMIPKNYRIVMHIVLSLVALDAAKYYYKRGSMAGVPYTLPLVSLIAMIVHPVRFWAEMANIAMANDGLCANTLLGHFLIFATDVDKCRTILTGEGTYGVYAHPNALWLFDPKNLIYMDKVEHKRFRSILTPALFSSEALMQYAQVQDRIVRKFLAKYAQDCQQRNQPIDARFAFRTMAAAASQESFMGPYLTDDIREQLERDIVIFTMGFLHPPFPYFGSGLHRAIQAKKRIETIVQSIVPKARAYMRIPGNEPRCMIEHWAVSIITVGKKEGHEPEEVPLCDDDNISRSVLDFLFAAQDATNSALTYSLDVLAAHPEVVEKVRQEIAIVCPGDDTAQNVWKWVRDPETLPYTTKVANQLLHHKPPVPMIPYLTKKDTMLGGYSVSRGTIAIPSIMYSARASGTSVEFLPERPDADPLFLKTLTFGGGQHKCPGRRYAETCLTAFVAVLCANFDFERVGPRPSDDEFIYFPTLFPKDNLFLIRPRIQDGAK